MNASPQWNNSYGATGAKMAEDERHHVKLDFNMAEEARTDEALLAWLKKYGRRVADHLWSPA